MNNFHQKACRFDKMVVLKIKWTTYVEEEFNKVDFIIENDDQFRIVNFLYPSPLDCWRQFIGELSHHNEKVSLNI